MKKVWIMTGIILIIFFTIVLVITQTKMNSNLIRIGAILPLTGDGSSLGEDCKNGIELAEDILNSHEGVNGKKIMVLYEDSQGKPDQAVNALHKFILQGIRIIIGDLFSSPTLAMAPLADKNKVLLFSPGASNPKLSNISKYVFRNYPSDNYEGKLIAIYIYQQGYKKIAILYPNNDYGVGLKSIFRQKFTELGGEIVFMEGYEDNVRDFRTMLAKVRNQKPDALYLPGYYNSIALIAKQLIELGMRMQLFSNIGIEDPKIFELGANAIEGLIYTAPAIDFKSEDPLIRNFVETFSQKYGQEPGFPAAHGYDSLNFLIQAISKSKNLNPDNLANTLLNIEFHGVTGSYIKFQPSGDVIKPFFIKKIENGRFLKVREIKEAQE